MGNAAVTTLVSKMLTSHGGIMIDDASPECLVYQLPGSPSRIVIVDVLPDGIKNLDDLNNYLNLCRFTHAAGPERAFVRNTDDIARLEARLFGEPPAGKVIPFRQKGGGRNG